MHCLCLGGQLHFSRPWCTIYVVISRRDWWILRKQYKRNGEGHINVVWITCIVDRSVWDDVKAKIVPWRRVRFSISIRRYALTFHVYFFLRYVADRGSDTETHKEEKNWLVKCCSRRWDVYVCMVNTRLGEWVAVNHALCTLRRVSVTVEREIVLEMLKCVEFWSDVYCEVFMCVKSTMNRCKKNAALGMWALTLKTVHKRYGRRVVLEESWSSWRLHKNGQGFNGL